MRDFERRLQLVEMQRRASVRRGFIEIDDKKLRAGVTAAEQLEQQEAALDFPVPPGVRARILANKPRDGAISITFFDDNEV